ncbi:hypothetical protein [Kitasatospora sp. NPDC088783]|uniref:hypothetical protein n=1 Tax=Kitasatospora sp. NPDC088783 TaxID=3364077 RepID=UPI0038060637
MISLPPIPLPAVRPRGWWHHTWTLTAAVVGTALLAAALACGIVVPFSVAEERAYRAAAPCPADAAPDADCLYSLTARVRGTHIDTRPKQQQFTLRLDGPPPVPAELDFPGQDPLLRHLLPGEQVTVTHWHEYTVAVTRGTTTQTSSDTPIDEPELITGLALILLTLGTYTLNASVLARRPRPAGVGLPSVLADRAKAALTAAVWTLPAGLLAATWGGPPLMLLAWATILPTLRWWLRHRARRTPPAFR